MRQLGTPLGGSLCHWLLVQPQPPQPLKTENLELHFPDCHWEKQTVASLEAKEPFLVWFVLLLQNT